MTTPIYALPLFSTATSALGAYGLQQQLPSPLLSMGAYTSNRMAPFGDDSSSSDYTGAWSSIGDALSKAFGGAVETGLKALTGVVQQKINQMAGYKDTGKVQAMKDGRVAAILQSPQGTLVALYPDGSTEPYLPSNAASAPTTTAELLSGKTTMGIGVVVALAAIAAIFLLRRKR
jgi:hypothetical protein